ELRSVVVDGIECVGIPLKPGCAPRVGFRLERRRDGALIHLLDERLHIIDGDRVAGGAALATGGRDAYNSAAPVAEWTAAFAGVRHCVRLEKVAIAVVSQSGHDAARDGALGQALSPSEGDDTLSEAQSG